MSVETTAGLADVITCKEKISFVGDCLPVGFPGLPDGLAGGALVGNLEAAVSEYRRGVGSKAYRVFVGSRDVEALSAAGFVAMSVANNHASDAGVEALNAFVDSRPIGSLPILFGVRDRPYAALRVAGRSVAVIGCLEPCRSRSRRMFPEEDVETLVRQLRPSFDLVVVFPHWGKEGEFAHHPSPTQRKRAARWIGAGADAVFGHHPHTVHGREWFEGRPVYYSLGNFWYDHQESRRYPATSLGLAITLEQHADEDVRWAESFLITSENRLRVLGQESAVPVRAALDSVSEDLAANPWNLLRWARTVGPVYSPKSSRSWAIRARRHPWKTLPLRAVWNCLPATRLLHVGSLLPNRRGLAARRDFEELARSLGGREEMPS